MKFLPMAPCAALAALVLVGGCSRTTTKDTAAGDRTTAGTALASAELPRPPAIPDEATDAEAAPLNDAGEIASEISGNTMIARVPVDGGLAWVEDGQVVRTASRDGQHVAYFHPGENQPFFVQKHGFAFAYDGGRPDQAYDAEGNPRPVSDAARMEATRLASLARRERELAARQPAAANHAR